MTTMATTSRAALTARHVQRQGALVVLALIVIVSAIVFPNFGTADNFTSIARSGAFLAVMALGMTFVIITGGIDLSVGSMFALCGVLAAWGSGHGALVGIVLPLGMGALVGLVQGLVITRGGLPPFIVTLAGLLFGRGLLLALTDEGSTTYHVPDGSALSWIGQGRVLGLPVPVWIVVVLFVLGGLLLRRTSFGTSVLAVGGQEDAARLMGLPVDRTKLLAYVLSGLMAGLAGLMLAAYTSSGATEVGKGTELEVISAVVLGGTLLTGGAGTVLGTLVGVLLLQVIKNVINQIGTLDSDWQLVVTGCLLLLVATLQRYLTRGRPG